MARYAQVIINFATVSEIDKFFTYRIPEALIHQVVRGSRVSVPFGRGNNFQMAYVMGVLDDEPVSNYKIKSLVSVIEDEPILSEDQLQIAEFMVSYYGCSYAAAIDVLLPPGLTSKPLVYEPTEIPILKLGVTKEEAIAYIQTHAHKKSFEKQKQILEWLIREGEVPVEVIKQIPELSLSSVQTLIKNQLVQKSTYYKAFEPEMIKDEFFKQLNPEQAIAKERIEIALEEDCYKGFLLQGVTGSGKTEVFLYAIREIIRKSQTAIVLVPEIALTSQTLSRFKERFGNQVALTHSRMTPVQRQKLYLRAKAGEIKVVIGPRSAVFMPLPNLGLIVVDEEHESTYKSEVTPKYHATEIAKMRMAYHKGVMILASATPSLESFADFKKGKLERLLLTERAGGANLPSVELVDLREEMKNGNLSVISRTLHEAIETTLRDGNQVMLLLNRRGHSTFINCRSCGFVVKCKHCDLSLTYHRETKRLECHYCGHAEGIPEICPSCGGKHIRFFGNGTQKVEEYLMTHFERYGVGRMDFDTTSGKEGHSKILEAFQNREFNILVGTQMIAKGHDFPNVTLVGIIAADMSLYLQDFRSEERTFHLLTQTLGRAGRGSQKGRVVIQTYNPEHEVLQHVKQFKQEEFYEELLKNRECMGYPPYTHLFHVLISGKNENEVISAAHMLGQYYQYYNKKKFFRLLGPTSAAISRMADDYRWKIMIVGEERENLLLYGKYCLNKFNLRENTDTIKITWDIDPYTML